MHQPYVDEQVAQAPVSREEADVSQPPIQRVSFVQLLKLNKPDWYIVLIGIVFSAAMGCMFPVIAIYFGDVLGVCTYTVFSQVSTIILCILVGTWWH